MRKAAPSADEDSAEFIFMKAVGLVATIAGAAICSGLLALVAVAASEQYYCVPTASGAEVKALYGGLMGGMAIAIAMFGWVRRHGFGVALVVVFSGTPWIVFSSTVAVQFATWKFPGLGNMF